MDRNFDTVHIHDLLLVALRKESVDRNIPRGQLPTAEPPSLSARRAWIEIVNAADQAARQRVALRKESVDRNISALASYNIIVNVALRKESVDRNWSIWR